MQEAKYILEATEQKKLFAGRIQGRPRNTTQEKAEISII